MTARRNLAVCMSLSLAVLFSLAAEPLSVLAQGGGGFKPAGNYNNTGMLGSFFFNDSASQTSIFVFANRQQTVGPNGTTDETTLFLNVSTGFDGLNVSCSIDDNSSDFKVTSDAQSANLHKTLTPNTPGCGGSVTSDIVVDITWTGAGPIQSTTTSNQFSCNGYTDESQGTDSDNAGPATFDITGLAGLITTPDPQTFHFSSSLEHVQGAVPPDSCHGSVGRGAGRATPAAGNYHTTFQNAVTNGSSSDGTTSLSMFVGANTSTSNPVSGGSTSTSETDLEFNLFGPTVSAGGCFVINSGDFRLSASTASLHTVLTGATPACGGGSNVLPTDPFAIDMTWTGTAPVGTTRTNQQFACLNYHFQTSRVQVVDSVADAQVSMPGLIGTLPSSSTIGSIDTRTHADGTPAAGCFFRG